MQTILPSNAIRRKVYFFTTDENKTNDFAMPALKGALINITRKEVQHVYYNDMGG